MSLDLRTGSPIWMVHSDTNAMYPQLLESVNCDVLIVGSGITGALLAYEFARTGMEIVVVDKGVSGYGSTAASTALLSYEIDEHLIDLANSIGLQKAVRVLQLGAEAVEHLEILCAKLSRSCGFTKRSSVYFASTEEDAESLVPEYWLRKRNGFDVEYLRADELKRLFSFYSAAAIISHNVAEVDPLCLARALLEEAVKNGVRIYNGSEVRELECSPLSVTAGIANGVEIQAKHVMFATGYESSTFLDLPNDRLKSTYVVCTHPVQDFQGWHQCALIWLPSN